MYFRFLPVFLSIAMTLIKLFSPPLFAGCKSDPSCHIPGDIIPIESHKYWVTLIEIHAGLGVQEILHPYLEDSYERDGIWLFDLNTNLPNKRLKTPPSPSVWYRYTTNWPKWLCFYSGKRRSKTDTKGSLRTRP